MSWASHNPEQYTRIMVQGVTHFLGSFMSHYHTHHASEKEIADRMVEFSQAPSGTVEHLIWKGLTHAARHEVAAVEREYFSSLSRG